MKKIFIIEDNEEIVRLLEFNLKKQGYITVSASDGCEALRMVHREKPDLILLDIMLPGMDGYEICRNLRRMDDFKKTPVIMLSAKNEEFDVILGLELGADDYIVKPFGIRELVSRIKTHLRRNDEFERSMRKREENEDTIMVAGDITLKLEEYKVYVQGKPVHLTQKEFELLNLLMHNKGRVLNRFLLMEKIWGFDSEADTRTVDVHIRFLRKKIEEDPANPRYIKTTRGVGYYFDQP